MAQYDMTHNGSGYYDETPVKTGLFTTPMPGEIWGTSNGKHYVILKSHGAYCIVLYVTDKQYTGSVEIAHGSFVNPAMVCYLFNHVLFGLKYTMSQEKYMEIMEAVAESLGVTIRVNKQETPEEHAKMQEMQEQVDRMKSQHEMDKMYISNLESSLEQAKESSTENMMYKRLYNDLVEKLIPRKEGEA